MTVDTVNPAAMKPPKGKSKAPGGPAAIIRAARSKLGVGPTEFSRLLQCSKRSVFEWEAGDKPPRAPVLMIAVLIIDNFLDKDMLHYLQEELQEPLKV